MILCLLTQTVLDLEPGAFQFTLSENKNRVQKS